MDRRDIIVIGTSAGGVEALTGLVASLPADLPAAVLVTVHIPSHAVSRLPEILSRAGRLPAAHAQDGQHVEAGHIYIAPPNYHLLLEDGSVRLSLSARVNHTRPAIDPLFMSAAHAAGPRVIGIILSGMLDDGTAGLMDIKQQGGLAMVQDPNDALYRSMPLSALEHVGADYILPVSQMGAALMGLTQEQQRQQQEGDQAMPRDARDIEEMPPAQEVVTEDIAAQEQGARNGMLTVFTCPECGGSLWQANAGSLIRFRCHTGHTMTGATLFAEQADSIEKSLWYAARSLWDKARLARQLANNARARGAGASALRFETKGQTDERHAEALERMIEINAAVNQAPE